MGPPQNQARHLARQKEQKRIFWPIGSKNLFTTIAESSDIYLLPISLSTRLILPCYLADGEYGDMEQSRKY